MFRAFVWAASQSFSLMVLDGLRQSIERLPLDFDINDFDCMVLKSFKFRTISFALCYECYEALRRLVRHVTSGV